MTENVILLAGLPGSGKTTLLCQMSKEGWLVFDDFKAGAANLNFRNSLKFGELVGKLRDGLRCAVADIDFCSTESREEANSVVLSEVPSLSLGWHFFVNDTLACEANIRSRNRPCLQDELGYLRKYSPSYNIPPGAIVLPVGRACTIASLRTEN